MDEVRIDIQAPAANVYELVADITNMGRWSPETHRTAWLDGATTAVPGARFKGWNKAKIGPVPAQWSTTCVVRQADPGRAFAFDTITSGARWTYRFEPTGDHSCEVIETREVLDAPLHSRLLEKALSSIRGPQLIEGMQVTLQRLKAAAEAA